MPAGSTMEDNVIPFRQRTSRHLPVGAKQDNVQVSRIEFSKLVNDMCFELSKKYRFNVMRDGVPEDKKIAHNLTTRLRRALEPIASEFGATALYNLMGVRVFFSQVRTEYKNPPHEPHVLCLRNDFSEAEIQRLIRPLVAAMTPAQRTANTNIHNLILGER